MFTPEQQSVIEAPRANLLVSAAAGSGKTAVLTERIVRRIIQGELDLQQILVVTFTDSAARNMRARIEDKLRDALENEQDPARRRLILRQLSWLPGAAISTIHAFCLQVIRTFYYLACDEAGQPLIEPGFVVEDSFESDMLLRRTLDEWFDSQYENIDLARDGPSRPTWIDAFYRLTDGFGDARGDQPVREQILRLYHYLRSLPDYPSFVAARLADLSTAAQNFVQSPHARVILNQLRLRLERALAALPELTDLLPEVRFIADHNRQAQYVQQFSAILASLAALDQGLRRGISWDEVVDLTRPMQTLEMPRANRADSEAKRRFMALFAESASEVVHMLSGRCGSEKYRSQFLFPTTWLFTKPAAAIERELAEMLPSVELLFALLLGLDQRYQAQKRLAGQIDFSDFEHLALQILRQDEAMLYYRQRFREVYVDEYQDTSSIQESIIRCVSCDNCLMVGDIKQSIYRFRHARPQIFREKTAEYGDNRNGSLFLLTRNFRSLPGIIAAVNDVFLRLMSRGAGEITYDDSQALVPWRDPGAEPTVCLLLLNREGETSPADRADTPEDDGTAGIGETEQPVWLTDLQDLRRDEQEARMVVKTLQRLHADGTAWREIVLLARTRQIIGSYREQLELAGIPIESPVGSMFLDTPTLRVMEALIHVLDNPRQDIPLAAVLHSDLFAGRFSIDELAQIRLIARRRSELRTFHEAVLAYRTDGDDLDLRQRLDRFLGWLADLRAHAQVMSLSELIGAIGAGSGWPDSLVCRPDGPVRLEQLRTFRQWLEAYERQRPKGLFRLARHLENLRSREKADLADERQPADDAVRLMTIHASKGLEFPVVFLVGTGYSLSPRDTSDHVLLSESLGIGFDYADPERQIRYPTHFKQAMREELHAADLAEELRLLYVAMTRAMNRLYLCGTVRILPNEGDRRLAMLLEQGRRWPDRLPGYLVLSARSYLEWFVLALANHTSLDLSFLSGSSSVERAEKSGSATDPWSVTLFQLEQLAASAPVLDQPVSPLAAVEALAPAAPEPVRPIPDLWLPDRQRTAAGSVYRYARAARMPAKLSVSELKRREQRSLAEEPDDAQQGQTVVALPAGIDLSLRPDRIPAADDDVSLGTGQSAGAKLGTVLHTAFRYLDLASARRNAEPAEIDRQLDLMAAGGMIDADERVLLQNWRSAVLGFVRSELAGQILAAQAQGSCYTEMPFTLALPVGEIDPPGTGYAPDDRILVQGIIDCWYQDDAGVTLIDYKSDWIDGPAEQVAVELARRYARQLDFYARAITAATGEPVCRRLIWHIRSARALPVG
jgi:ATP-dependent helicase/nuclease subunit A